MSLPLLDPRNDFVFKLLFTRALPLLTDLINAVRFREAPITVVKVRNPRIDPDELQGKFIVLDILAEDDKGQLFDIEMQVCRHEQWRMRSMYYLSKTVAGQLQSGQSYDQLKPVVGIHLLGYDLFSTPGQAIWCFEMRDRENPDMVLGNELQLNIIEMAKGDRLAQQGLLAAGTAQPLQALMAWLTYFQHGTEESIMNQIAWPPVAEAWKHLQELSADEETRRLAEVRERALKDEIAQISAAEQRGIAIGEQRGAAKAKQELLQNLIDGGMSEAQARQMLKLG